MMEMVIKYVVLLIVLCECNLCLKLNGTCPVVENVDAFICTDHFQDAVNVFKILSLLIFKLKSLNLSGSPFPNGSSGVGEQILEFIL